MKATRGYSQFAKDLAKTQAPVYLLTGTDEFLKREALRKISDALVPGEARLLNCQSFLAADCSWSDVEAACLSVPLFSERRVVALIGVELFAESELAGFLKYAKRPSESTCLVAVSTSAGDDSRKRGMAALSRLIGEATGSVATYTFWPGNKLDSRAWVCDWLKGNGKSMNDAVLRQVLEAGTWSCYEVWNVLEKAAGLVGERQEIKWADVESVGGAASVGSTAAFRLAVASADGALAHTTAARCLEAGTQPTLLLWLLGRSFGEALRIPERAVGARVAWRDKQVLEALWRRFDAGGLARCLSLIYETERGVKNGFIEPRVGLEVLINELTG